MDDADERLAKLLAKALKAFIADGYRRGQEEMRERAAFACQKAVPLAHTYASENADLYRTADATRDRCITAIAALPIKEFGE